MLMMIASIALASCADLPAALAKAKAGDTITLPAGPCGVIAIAGRSFDTPVTIRSADPARPAVFSRLVLTGSSGLTFTDIEVSYVTKPGESNATQMVRVNGGGAIVFDRIVVHGKIDGNVRPDGNGISAVGVNGFTVRNSRLVEVNAGIAVNGGRNVRISGNDIGFIGSDAIEIPGCDGVVIDWNVVHDFRTNAGLHPDFVQCWTTRQKSGCKNVRIISNEVSNAPGNESQGVFFGDEDQVGGYENIEITGNLFLQTWWHAISITGTPKNVAIRYNRVVAGANIPTPWIRVGGPAVVEGNVAPAFFIGTKTSVVPAGNEIGGASR